MFDARSLFEQMVRGARQPTGGPTSGGQGGGLGDIGDLLRQFTQQGGAASGGEAALPAGQGGGGSAGSAFDDLLRQLSQKQEAAPSREGDDVSSGPGGNPLEELMRQLGQSGTAPSAPQMQELPDAGGRSDGRADGRSGSGGGFGGGLGDLLGQVLGGGRAGSAGADQGAPAGGGVPDLRELFEKIGGSTGGTGGAPGGTAGGGDLMRQLTDFLQNNKLGAGAALGGLGALVLGTRTGRSLATSAAKLGALALVGGLAYKAYQNYSQGRPLVSGSVQPEAAPSGTGFEAEEVSNEAAVTYIRGMIAAAAADGRISAEEQQAIIGSLAEQGLDAGAEEFLANELNTPASIDDLIAGVSSETEALQLYTAARVSIEPDTGAEQQFLAVLGDRLGITPDLRAHVDAMARGMA